MLFNLNPSIIINTKNGVLHILNQKDKVLLSYNSPYEKYIEAIKYCRENTNISLDDLVKILDKNSIIELLKTGILKVNIKLVLASYTKTSPDTIYFPNFKKYISFPNIYDHLKNLDVENFDLANSTELPLEFEKLLVGILNVPVDTQKHNRMINYSPTGLTILLTSKCNLKCSYCYASSGKVGETVEFKYTKSIIDFLVQNHKNSKPIEISFLGGGEPTVEWEKLVQIVDYCKSIQSSSNIIFNFGITTNGAIDPYNSKWLVNNFQKIKVSFDGVEEIHNKQRPSDDFNSYNKTFNFLKLLSDQRKKFNICMTISSESLLYLEESLNLIKREFLPETVILNPVFQLGRAVGCHSTFSSENSKRIYEVKKIFADAKFKIVIPHEQAQNQNFPKESFCGFQRGKMYLTPTGEVTMCPKVDKRTHPFFEKFNFANWNPTQEVYNFDLNKFRSVVENSLSANSKSCVKCPSQIYCAGVCYLKHLESIQIPDCKKTINSLKMNANFL